MLSSRHARTLLFVGCKAQCSVDFGVQVFAVAHRFAAYICTFWQRVECVRSVRLTLIVNDSSCRLGNALFRTGGGGVPDFLRHGLSDCDSDEIGCVLGPVFFHDMGAMDFECPRAYPQTIPALLV
jgi:hypothetical protein